MTPKQRRFVEEYLVDLDAAAAARRAGYSERTARQIGYENLTKPDVAAAIAAARAERAARTELTQDMVVKGLLREARLTGEGSSHSARVSAWAQLGRHLGMFVDRQRIEGSLSVEVVEELVDAGGRAEGGEAPRGPTGVPEE